MEEKPRFLDIADIVFLVGLGMLGYGTYQIYPPAAFIAVGTISMILTLYPRLKVDHGHQHGARRPAS